MKIASIGDNCVDNYASLGRQSFGGNCVNVAVRVAKLGMEAAYVGALGDDETGKNFLAALKAQHLDTSHVKVLPGKTAVTQVELKNNDRVFGDYDAGVTKVYKPDAETIAWLSHFDVVHSALWGEVTDELPKIRKAGAPIAFDFCDKLDHELVAKVVPNGEIAYYSYDESDDAFIKDYMKKIHSKGPRLVVTTRGKRGSMAYDGKEFYYQDIIDCKVVDTMGAGDSYIGAYLTNWVKGKSVSECMLEATKVSTEVIQHEGAWS
jgi:fructoselysine 6-kinase